MEGVKTLEATNERASKVLWRWIGYSIAWGFASIVIFILITIGCNLAGFTIKAPFVTQLKDIITSLISLSISFFAFCSLFTKPFKSFCLRMVYSEPPKQVSTTKRRILEAWWFCTWRGWLYSIPALLGAIYLSRFIYYFPRIKSVTGTFLVLLTVATCLLIQLCIIQSMFRKKFSDFQIVLEQRKGDKSPHNQSTKSSVKRTEEEWNEIVNKMKRR